MAIDLSTPNEGSTAEPDYACEVIRLRGEKVLTIVAGRRCFFSEPIEPQPRYSSLTLTNARPDPHYGGQSASSPPDLNDL